MLNQALAYIHSNSLDVEIIPNRDGILCSLGRASEGMLCVDE